VTAAAIPAADGRPLLAKLASAIAVRSRSPRSRSRIATVVTAARQHVMTAAALTAADLGGFTVFHHGGWFVLGASILALHFDVAG
jgi:hypothetical protein